MADRRFQIQGPATINVSGGRTSGMMLHHILEAHGGELPPDVFAIFCNTGREMPATLDFIAEMESRWGVHIQWLEYRRDPETGRVWSEKVSHNSASREGEPFNMMLEGKAWLLPNPVAGFCTIELKIRTCQRWIDAELGWHRWRNYVGLRADEMHRVIRAGVRNGEKKSRFRVSCPLAKARMTEQQHVLPFWRAQPFDLGLAGPWEGNCDGCFKKRIGSIRRMMQDHPERMRWWAAAETHRADTAGKFRVDREGYAEIAEWVRRNPMLPGTEGPVWDVIADCEGGCGV